MSNSLSATPVVLGHIDDESQTPLGVRSRPRAVNTDEEGQTPLGLRQRPRAVSTDLMEDPLSPRASPHRRPGGMAANSADEDRSISSPHRRKSGAISEFDYMASPRRRPSSLGGDSVKHQQAFNARARRSSMQKMPETRKIKITGSEALGADLQRLNQRRTSRGSNEGSRRGGDLANRRPQGMTQDLTKPAQTLKHPLPFPLASATASIVRPQTSADEGGGTLPLEMFASDPLQLQIGHQEGTGGAPAAQTQTFGTLRAMTNWLDRNTMGDPIRKQNPWEIRQASYEPELVNELRNMSVLLDNKWFWILLVSAMIVIDSVIVVMVNEDHLKPEVAMPIHCAGDLFFLMEFFVNVLATSDAARRPRLWWEAIVLTLALICDWVLNLIYRTILQGESPKYGTFNRGPIMLLRFYRLRRLELLVPHDAKNAAILRRSRPSRVVRRVLTKGNELFWPIMLPLCFLCGIAGIITRSTIQAYGDDIKDEVLIDEYFESVQECLITYLMVAIRASADWGMDIYKPLLSKVPGLAITFLICAAGVEIWVMNTLLGIVVEAVLSAGKEDDTMVQWYLQQQKAQSDQLRTLLQRMDINKDGCISFQELKFAYQSDPGLSIHLGLTWEQMQDLFNDYDVENTGMVSVPVLLFAAIMSTFHRDMEGNIEHYIIKTALNTIAANETAMSEVGKEMQTSMQMQEDFKKMLTEQYAEHSKVLNGLVEEFNALDKRIETTLLLILSIDWDGPDKFIPPKARNIATKQMRQNLSVLEVTIDRWMKAMDEPEAIPTCLDNEPVVSVAAVSLADRQPAESHGYLDRGDTYDGSVMS